MPHLLSLQVGGTIYHDARTPHPQFDLHAGYDLYTRILDERMDTMREFLDGEEPGCDVVRDKVAQELYDRHRRSIGNRELIPFHRWRENYERRRSCPDPTTDEAFLFLAYQRDGNVPIGGIVLYSVELLGRDTSRERTVSYRAMCAPMSRPREASAFMRAMLDGPLIGVTDDGSFNLFQLVQWRFPTEERRNRWDLTSPLASEYLSEFGQHDLTLETRGAHTFPVKLDRVAK